MKKFKLQNYLTPQRWGSFSALLLSSIFLSQASAMTDVSTPSQLSSAVSGASSGDTIRLLNDITITGQLSINGKTITFLGQGNTLTVPQPGVLNNGENNGSGSSFRVFSVSGTGTLVVHDMSIIGGHITSTTDGGGCILNDGKTYLYNCRISNGRVSTSIGGGGIFQNSSSARLFMYDCLVERNSAYKGGGFMNLDGARIIAERTTFRDNRTENTQGGGGAAENFNSYLLTVNCTFANNQSTERGGAVNHINGKFTAIHTTFTGNLVYGTELGGAIGLRGPTYTFNCLFAYNYEISGGSITDPSAWTLNDVDESGSKSSHESYYTVKHGVFETSSSTGVYSYSNSKDGSNDAIFAGGLLDYINDGQGATIGSGTGGKVFRPHLYGSNKSVRLKATTNFDIGPSMRVDYDANGDWDV